MKILRHLVSSLDELAALAQRVTELVQPGGDVAQAAAVIDAARDLLAALGGRRDPIIDSALSAAAAAVRMAAGGELQPRPLLEELLQAVEAIETAIAERRASDRQRRQ